MFHLLSLFNHSHLLHLLHLPRYVHWTIYIDWNNNSMAVIDEFPYL
jgi:hypothetical protein